MNNNMINQELSLEELDNISGGAKCPGCGKKTSFLFMWLHKAFCVAYQSKKMGKAISNML